MNVADPITQDDKRAQVTRAVAKAMESVYWSVYWDDPCACEVAWQHNAGPTHMTSNLPGPLMISMLAEAIQRVVHGPAAGRVDDPTAPAPRPS